MLPEWTFGLGAGVFVALAGGFAAGFVALGAPADLIGMVFAAGASGVLAWVFARAAWDARARRLELLGESRPPS